ncbi:putative transcription factor WD40-like family [Lupinus albus]|uniref:Putative transcription factor WD40-like family n=1 Tax=Lupinus albus TaxID=3870 RepID=A0A6A4QL65_LUPAL|nr:putative transcription factor WD40-like family [Lupinus albus]
MDEELNDEATRLEVVDGVQNDDFSLNPECPKILKHYEIHDGQGNNVVEATSDVTTSQHFRPSLFSDDGGAMVEELTVKSYNGLALDIGTSNSREGVYNKQNQRLHLNQIGSDSGTGNTRSDTGYINSVLATSSSVWEDFESTTFEEILARKSVCDNQSNAVEHLNAVDKKPEHKEGPGEAHRGIRTKIMSKSGFAEYFIKNTLKGKGIVCKGPSSNDSFVSRDHNPIKATRMDNSVSLSSGLKTANSPHNATMPRSDGSDFGGVTLREWLKAGHCKGSKAERLSIFRKVVDLVDESHSQGVALHHLCPSYIKLLPSNQVMYLGLPIQKQTSDSVANSEVFQLQSSFIRKRLSEQAMPLSLDMQSKKKKVDNNVRVSGDSKVSAVVSEDYCNEYKEDIRFTKHNIRGVSSIPRMSNAGKLQLTSINEGLESKWYTSLEGGCTTSSNIYCLGVLFFELLGHFDSERAHIAAMSDIRNRILPPGLLSQNPKEAGFCLWMLHPEPSSRPTTREILQSEVINGMQEVYSEELSLSIDQDDTESELLLHFLVSLEEQKQMDVGELEEEIRWLESDIEEVERRHSSRISLAPSSLQNDSSCQIESASLNKEPSRSATLPPVSPISNAYELKLRRNISEVESAYFSMRSKIELPEIVAANHPDKDILRNRENWCVAQKDKKQHQRTDALGAFFDGLCKYACYSKFVARGVLRNADFNSPANVICSLSFDRDEDYFAAAGISKKIKVFEFNALLNDSVDIHYPVVEMSNRSKLSCVCWNNYIKNYLASTDYDGIVKLWDASRGQEFSQFSQHEKRAWSVDFSPVCPTKFASGSDDCSVKLWSISERNCLGTIRNAANVCCVQFSAHSSHLLAFGSADYSTYCYDLRNLRSPWCVLAGHRKAVSYVKFLDSQTIVSASTDNSLKIWDLNKTSPVGPSTSACSLTLSGHTNEKNFVGLSVADGYIACGSETNEVYAYYKSLPIPVTSCKFGSTDPISGKESDDDNGQFVSSVCWRGKSNMVIAANSSGCMKVFQMV